ncbi:MAG: M23 family metallopeptidase [Spirochaetia bacterium]|nr:M23 family metallopeptidase [Spirochaetia bacterium]
MKKVFRNAGKLKKQKKKPTISQEVYTIEDTYIESKTDLKKNFLLKMFNVIFNKIKNIYRNIISVIWRKKNEKLTLMFIPHNDKKTRNFHISNLTMTIASAIVIVIVLVSSVLIINHTSTIQEVDKLKISQEEAKIQFEKIKDEIKSITGIYEEIRQNIGVLYSMAKGKDIEEADNIIFAHGGASIPINENGENAQHLQSVNELPLEISVLNRILEDMKISKQPLDEIEEFIKKRKKIISNTPTLWPVKGYIINPYGFIRDSEKMNVFFNKGIDIAAVPGAEVLSAAPGIVTSVKKDSEWMWEVRVRHNFGYETVYKGLERIVLSKDDKINKGERIGFMGHSKNRMEPVLKYQIIVGVEPQNPMPYLTLLGAE